MEAPRLRRFHYTADASRKAETHRPFRVRCSDQNDQRGHRAIQGAREAVSGTDLARCGESEGSKCGAEVTSGRHEAQCLDTTTTRRVALAIASLLMQPAARSVLLTALAAAVLSSFEIACYKNKVLNWRSKIEKDLNEVLQSNYIFTNVSKGVSANNADLQSCFGTTDFVTIACEILAKGDLQISEKERALEMENKFKDIASIIVEKCINAETRRPFSIGMIERSMREQHFSVNANRTTKQQALELIKSLKAVLPIERAQMRIKVELPLHYAKSLKPKLTALASSVVAEEFLASSVEIVMLIDPGAYRSIEELLAKECTKGKILLEIVDLKVQMEGEARLESEEAEREMREQGLDKLPAGDHSHPHAHAHSSAASSSTAAAASAHDEDADEVAAKVGKIRLGGAADDSDDDTHGKRRGKAKPKKHAAGASTGSGDDDAVPKPPKAKKDKAAKKSKKAAAAAASDSEDDGPSMQMAQKKQKKSAALKKAKAQAAAAAKASSSESDSDATPAPVASKSKPTPAAKPWSKRAPTSSDSDSSSSEDDAPVQKKKPAPAAATAPAQKKAAQAASSSSESDSDPDLVIVSKPKAAPAPAVAAPMKKAPPAKKKRGGSDSDEEIKIPNQSQIDAEEAEEAARLAATKAAAAASASSAKSKDKSGGGKKAAKKAESSESDSDDAVAQSMMAKKKSKQKKKKAAAAAHDSD